MTTIRLALLAAVAAAAGCAAPMALKPGDTQLDLGNDGLVLFSTHVTNVYKDYEVRAVSVVVERKLDDADRARIAAAKAAATPTDPAPDEGGSQMFQVSDPVGQGGTPGNSWEQRLVVLKLPPGTWETSHVNLEAGGFPVKGIGWAKLRAAFRVQAGAVTYVGRIVAKRRERVNDNETWAGPPLPLIDQSVTGFSGGTVDVTVADEGDTDIPQAKSVFPALQRFEIGKAILVPLPPK